LNLLASYANDQKNGYPARLLPGDGFIGQCAVEKRRILVTDVPPEVSRIGSVLMQALPGALPYFRSSSKARSRRCWLLPRCTLSAPRI